MINMRLARERGLGEEDIETISYWHTVLEGYLSNAKYTNYDEDVYTEIEHLEYHLQGLWGFPQDPAFHTWKHRYKFKCQWVGRKFRCNVTGEEFTIPNSIEETDHLSFGGSSIDMVRLGDYYWANGNVEEITGECNED